jgi:ribonucleoside-triphosphate reductase
MLLAHKVSATKGNPYYINQVTYEDESIAMCCRLKHTIKPEDKEDIEEGRMRSNAIQNVTINLPRLAYLAKGDDAKLLELMRERMKWAKETHMIKREAMAKLLNSGNAPLLTMNKDGQPYLRLEKARHLIGLVGLNEMVKIHTGSELHESEKAQKFGWNFIRRMKEMCDEFSKETGYMFALEQTPAESTAYRFAKLDLKYFNGQAEQSVRGDPRTGHVYYTNSTHYNPSAVVPLPEKIRNEGVFHPLIEAGSLTHVWLGESSPDPEALTKFTLKMISDTMNQQIAYTRDLTYCESCGRLHGGLLQKCPDCGGTKLQSWSRITGYLQNIEGWNKGKQAELRDRYRYTNYFNGGMTI